MKIIIVKIDGLHVTECHVCEIKHQHYEKTITMTDQYGKTTVFNLRDAVKIEILLS